MGDLEIVHKFVSGDKPSRDEFLKQYSRLIYSYIHSVLAAKGVQAGQAVHIPDIFQGFFCHLLDNDCAKLRTFKGKNGATLATWLRQVTVNFTLSYLRRLKPAVSLDEERGEDSVLQDILPDDSAPAPELLAQDEKIKSLQECISVLGSDDKYFLELHLNQGLGFAELKDLLRVSRGAFDMRKSRIIGRLKECFKSKGYRLDF